MLGLMVQTAVSGQTALNEINNLGQSVISALQQNNSDAYLHHFLGKMDVSEYAGKYGSTKEEAEQARQEMEQAVTHLNTVRRGQFEQIIAEGISHNINWKDVQFSRVKVTKQIRQQNQLTFIDQPTIMYMYQGKEYEIPLNKMVKLDRGWVIVE